MYAIRSYYATDLTYKVQNIVTSADLGAGINLNKIAVGFNLERIEYEPELV